jgi:uncharacterized protein (TIGR00661 family)
MTVPSSRVLVAPLNWGLGHATRCIPVIRFLLKEGHHVFIASDGDALQLLRKEFPELPSYELAGYRPVYSTGSTLAFTLARQLPKFLRAIKKEHNQTNRLVEEEEIDAVISDNRYGVWSHKVPSAIIIHQVNLLAPTGTQGLARAVNFFHKRLLHKFNYIWVPDTEGSPLSGSLSHQVKLPGLRFIGPLSRFERIPDQANSGYDLVAVLSGPEPQRSFLEKILISQLPACGLTCLLVRGVINEDGISTQHGLTVMDFMPTNDLNRELCQASVVVARSGYSTIMDLARLGKKAILIPTPGQTEQVYLADRVRQKGYAFSVNQNEFSLTEALEKVKSVSGFPVTPVNNTRLTSALEELLR